MLTFSLRVVTTSEPANEFISASRNNTVEGEGPSLISGADANYIEFNGVYKNANDMRFVTLHSFISSRPEQRQELNLYSAQGLSINEWIFK